MAFDPNWLDRRRVLNPSAYEDEVLDRAKPRRFFRPHKPSPEVAKLLADQEE